MALPPERDGGGESVALVGRDESTAHSSSPAGTARAKPPPPRVHGHTVVRSGSGDPPRSPPRPKRTANDDGNGDGNGIGGGRSPDPDHGGHPAPPRRDRRKIRRRTAALAAGVLVPVLASQFYHYSPTTLFVRYHRHPTSSLLPDVLKIPMQQQHLQQKNRSNEDFSSPHGEGGSVDPPLPPPPFAESVVPPPPESRRCAICLYGLPRAFGAMVLPSLLQNVLRPNAPYQCDYFVHYYANVTYEAPGRSGEGGALDPDEILRLQGALDHVTLNSHHHNNNDPTNRTIPYRPVVKFVADTPDDFWAARGKLVTKVRTTKDSKGRYLYFPWKDASYAYPTSTDNILQMWHSAKRCWDLMRSHAAAKNSSIPFGYARVAMLRSDVLYVTPLDVWEIPVPIQPGTHSNANRSGNASDSGGASYRFVHDVNNTVAIIPGFSRWPVSDRLMYGPYRAVAIWASQRFQRMEKHVQWALRRKPGCGLHSETFVNKALLAPIRALGVPVREHPTLCFLRARSDGTVLTSDCKVRALPSVMDGLGPNVRGRVETLLGRKCFGSARKGLETRLNCSWGG